MLPRSVAGPWVLAGGGVIILGAIGVVMFAFRHPPYTPPLDDFGTVPAFAFQAETGAAFRTESMAGHVSIVDFIFTRCDTVCPASSARMLELQERTGDLDTRVGLVSFSVDPDYDTPAVLTKYGRDFHADPRRWRFVTGDRTRMKALIEGAFMTAVDDRGTTTASGNPDIWHGQHFLLVDQNLHIRGIYDVDDPPGLDKLERAARYLATHPEAAVTRPATAKPELPDQWPGSPASSPGIPASARR